jgi:hypothetical protein
MVLRTRPAQSPVLRAFHPPTAFKKKFEVLRTHTTLRYLYAEGAVLVAVLVCDREHATRRYRLLM